MKNITIGRLCREYLALKSDTVKPSTMANYEMKVDKHIAPFIGDEKVESVSVKTVNQFYDEMRTAEMSEGYIRDIGILMRSVFEYGHRTYNCSNAFKDVPLPRPVRKHIEVLSASDQMKVMQYGSTAEVIALSMGLRIGEVSGLKGEDVQDGVLRVSRTIQRIQKRSGGTKLIIGAPKSKDSCREIPVPEHLLPLFSAAPDIFIASGDRTPYEPRTIQNHWASFCKKHNIKPVKFHALRHTFATAALEAGIDVKTLSEILGHSTVELTMNLYCHPTMQHKAKWMNRLWKERSDK